MFHVEKSFCDGHGLCAVEAPEVFMLDDNDELVILQDSPDEQFREQVEAASRSCPKQAIVLDAG